MQKDYREEAVRIHKFVRDEIRYTKDVRGVETLHTVPQLLQQRQGDCDDKTVLISALLESIGHRTKLVAIGYGKNYCHVYPEVNIRGEWIGMEATENWPFGKVPPNPTKRMEQEI
ncbi:MAG: transglutaminase-like domain-containing protein [bacterium]|nr:transglutaminase-like domain-containing protein [bacterium]